MRPGHIVSAFQPPQPLIKMPTPVPPLRQQGKEIDAVRPDRTEVPVDTRNLADLQPLGYRDKRGISHAEREAPEPAHKLNDPVKIRLQELDFSVWPAPEPALQTSTRPHVRSSLPGRRRPGASAGVYADHHPELGATARAAPRPHFRGGGGRPGHAAQDSDRTQRSC